MMSLERKRNYIIPKWIIVYIDTNHTCYFNCVKIHILLIYYLLLVQLDSKSLKLICFIIKKINLLFKI